MEHFSVKIQWHDAVMGKTVSFDKDFSYHDIHVFCH